MAKIILHNHMKKRILIAVFCLTLAVLLNPTLVLADASNTVLENPLGPGVDVPSDLYARIIFSFMGVTGVIALLMFVIGGLQWMTAGGAADKVKKGKDTLIWAALGLILIFSSYAILRAIFETLRFQ